MGASSTMSGSKMLLSFPRKLDPHISLGLWLSQSFCAHCFPLSLSFTEQRTCHSLGLCPVVGKAGHPSQIRPDIFMHRQSF